ncbi:hypothetical protein COHA_007611 [Chlorella ohadii]|uniref:Protein kinase domain-containing protein n=1 Tax=Chlorella ohadii TaxID=2649997 RepID=A0AAD5DLJ9_9CHLO|nr:hypothetical protein COHA_007611 [Chlorella ohadii]
MRPRWHIEQLLAITALLLLCPRAAGQAVVPAPLSLEVGLRAIRDSITNWPELSAANNLSGWGADPSIPPCLYTGVTCDADGRLSSVSLQCPGCAVKAQGHLADEVAGLSTLTALNMQNNQLNGSLPAAYGEEGALPRLLNLVLSNNQLSGTLPAEWGGPGALPALSLLALGFNRLTGELPAQLALPSLLILRLHNNQLTGTLPPPWGTNSSMPHLRVASLQGNKLSAPLPQEWAEAGKLMELEEVHLQDNQLTGGLPPLWGGWGEEGLPALRVLNLSNNPIGGTLPYEWSQQHSFPSLRTLALSNISLQGTLPASWDCMEVSRCGLHSLQSLWLLAVTAQPPTPISSSFHFQDGNNLSGPVPPNWATAPASLQSVFVQPGNPLLLCDTSGGSDCRNEAKLPPCPVDEPQVTAAGITPDGNGSSTAAAAGGSGDNGGSSTGAIVGGVVGGVAAATAALAVLLDKSIYSLPPAGPLTPATNGAGGGPPQPLLPSPFAALAAELEPSPTHSSSEPAMGGIGERRRPFHKSASVGSLASKLLGAGGADIDHALDAEIDRHFSIEMASLQPRPPLSPLVDAAFTRSVASTAGTGGTASGSTTGALRRAASKVSSGGGSATLVPIEEGLPRLDPFSDWRITPDEIEICKRPDGSDWELGSGGFGKVYKALRHGAQPVAVKVLAAVGEARYQSQEEAFVREIALLRACRDPNVVAFLGACIQSDRTMLVTEYCDGGNLTRNLMAGRVTWYRRGKKVSGQA